MKITENQLYEMFSSNLNKVLMEGPKQQNNGPSIEGDFNQEYIDNNINKRGLEGPNASGNTQVNKKYLRSKLGKAALSIAGMGAGTILGAAAMGAAAGIGGFVLDVGKILNVAGLGLIAGQFAANHIALSRIKKLKFPNSPMMAMKYARYAAAERVNAQQICLNIQQNLKNAMNAWNQAYSTEKYNWETLLTALKNAGMQDKAQFQDRGQQQTIDADIDKNFTDKNVGQNEDIKRGSLLEASQYEKSIKGVGEFKQDFLNDKQEGLGELLGLANAYVQSYGIWMQWTRYINVLVHKFQKYGVTWERVIASNTKFGVKNTLITFANELFGTNMSLEDLDNKEEYRGKNQTTEIVLRLIDNNWGTGAKFGRYKGMSYILLQQEKTNNYFALEPIDFQTLQSNGSGIGGQLYKRDLGDGMMEIIRKNSGNNAQDSNLGECPNFNYLEQGQGIIFNYSPNMISSTTQDPNGKSVYILRSNAAFNMKVFKD